MLKPLTEYLSELTKQANSSDLLQFPLLNGILKRASEISQEHIRAAQDPPGVIARKEELRQNPQYRKHSAKPLFASKYGEIDNRAYAQAPYSRLLDFGKINQQRAQNNTLLPVPEKTNLLPDIYQVGGKSYHGGSARLRPVLMPNEGAVIDGRSLHQTPSQPPYQMRMHGYDKGYTPSITSGYSHEANHVNNWPTVPNEERIRRQQTASPGFSNDVYAHRPGEGVQVIAARKREEAARAKKQGLPPYEISTPGQLEGSLARLIEVDPYSPANPDLKGEEQRLRNYMRSSAEDYDRRNKPQINFSELEHPAQYRPKEMAQENTKFWLRRNQADVKVADVGKMLPPENMRPAEFGKQEKRLALPYPILPTTSTPYQPGTWAGHPVVRNIARTYEKTAPDIVKTNRNTKPIAQQPTQTQPPVQPPVQAQPQAPQPPVPPAPALAKQARVASTPNSSYNSFMNEVRLTKIAAILQKATDGLKLSDRPAGKRIQPSRVMSTPTSAELIRQRAQNNTLLPVLEKTNLLPELAIPSPGLNIAPSSE